jgi:hypothetical protein
VYNRLLRRLTTTSDRGGPSRHYQLTCLSKLVNHFDYSVGGWIEPWYVRLPSSNEDFVAVTKAEVYLGKSCSKEEAFGALWNGDLPSNQVKASR